MPGSPEQRSLGQNTNNDAARLEADLKEIDGEREKVERDQNAVRLLSKLIFPLVSFVAPLVFVFFALFAAFQLDAGTANAFSYAVIVSFVAISGIFGVLAYLSKRALTQTQFTFVRVFSAGIVDTNPALKEKLKGEAHVVLKQPQTVANWIKGGFEGYYANYAKKLKEPKRVGKFFSSVYALVSRRFLSPVYALVSRPFFFPAYALLTLVVISLGFASFMIQKSYLLQNSLLNQISIVFVLLFVFSYLAILSLWRRSLVGLHEPRIWGSEAYLNHVDYIHGTFPIRIRAGDSRQVLLHFLRDKYECVFPDTQYLEAEILAAGVDISSEKKLRLPDCFHTQKALWSCRFANTGKHTVTLSLNKVDSTKNTKDIIYATDFITEVVSPFRASLQVAVPIVISAISVLAALLTALRIHL